MRSAPRAKLAKRTPSAPNPVAHLRMLSERIEVLSDLGKTEAADRSVKRFMQTVRRHFPADVAQLSSNLERAAAGTYASHPANRIDLSRN